MPQQQIMGFVIILVFFAFFYFMAVRPQKKHENEIRQMREALKNGDEVITIGGFIGKIVQVKEDYVVLELNPGKTKVTVTKWAIGSLTPNNKNTEKKTDKKEADKKESDQKDTEKTASSEDENKKEQES